MKYKFGDMLNYTSPPGTRLERLSFVNKSETPCVFIRDEYGKAVVIFAHAEWVARVSYDSLTPCTYEETKSGNDYRIGYEDGYREGVKTMKDKLLKAFGGADNDK